MVTQRNNYGRGGRPPDYVNAGLQDGSLADSKFKQQTSAPRR
jgi:hypothetical protein